MYSEVDDISVRNHIFVHAVHEFIYRHVIKDENRLHGDKERMKKIKATVYVKSWEIVERDGYKNILNKFKNKVLSSNTDPT